MLHTLLAAALAAFTLLAPARAQGWPQIYDPLRLQVMELYMAPGDWTKISSDNSFSIEVPAAMHLAGEPWILISVRRKSGTPVGNKVSLKLDINELVSGQTWHGVKKLSLENGDDVDVLAEGFAWYLHQAAAKMTTGYLPGHAAWTALIVNGKYLGVYVNVEQVDKTFLKNRGLYSSGSTWLNKMSDVNSPELKVGTGISPTSAQLCYSPFVESKGGTVCPTPDPMSLAAELPLQVEMRPWLTYAAVSAFHSGPDQMFSKGKNFYYIDRVGKNRLYVPWDLDSVFGKTYESIYGRVQGGGIRQTKYQTIILLNPSFKAQYKRVFTDLLNGPLDPARLGTWLTQLEGSLLPLALQLDPNGKLSGNPHARFESLRQWVAQRALDVRVQLAK